MALRPEQARFEELAALAVAAEHAGFDCLWLPAAPAGLGSGPRPDPFVLGAALASRTSAIRLGCLAAPVAARAPSLLGKLVTSLDVLSGGRGIAGVDLGSAAPAVVAEALAVVAAMLHRDAPTIAGAYFSVVEAWNEPRRHDGTAPPLVATLPAGLDPGEILLEAIGRWCDGCALDVPDPELASRVAAVRAAAGAVGRELTVIGVLAGGGGAGCAPAALAAGCDALVAQVTIAPQVEELDGIAATLAATWPEPL